MKIKYDDSTEIQKVWHRKPGDVVRLHLDQCSPEGRDFYLVIEQDHDSTHLFNLTLNEKRKVSCAVRCTFYPNSQLNPRR